MWHSTMQGPEPSTLSVALQWLTLHDRHPALGLRSSSKAQWTQPLVSGGPWGRPSPQKRAPYCKPFRKLEKCRLEPHERRRHGVQADDRRAAHMEKDRRSEPATTDGSEFHDGPLRRQGPARSRSAFLAVAHASRMVCRVAFTLTPASSIWSFSAGSPSVAQDRRRGENLANLLSRWPRHDLHGPEAIGASPVAHRPPAPTSASARSRKR